MQLLKDRIRKDGVVKEGNVLKVDRFLNHQMDIDLFNEMGKEWARLFADRKITKILTVEASGIGIACVAAEVFDVPVVFATNISLPCRCHYSSYCRYSDREWEVHGNCSVYFLVCQHFFHLFVAFLIICHFDGCNAFCFQFFSDSFFPTLGDQTT